MIRPHTSTSLCTAAPAAHEGDTAQETDKQRT
jgi:hypothetical protein